MKKPLRAQGKIAKAQKHYQKQRVPRQRYSFEKNIEVGASKRQNPIEIIPKCQLFHPKKADLRRFRIGDPQNSKTQLIY